MQIVLCIVGDATDNAQATKTPNKIMKKSYLKPEIKETTVVADTLIAASGANFDKEQGEDGVINDSRRNRNDWNNIWGS